MALCENAGAQHSLLFLKHFWGVSRVRKGVLAPGLMCPLCAYRSDTGKLWLIPRTSGGEHRSLWKMPNSLVSSRAVFTALACLPAWAENADQQLFCPPGLPSLAHCRACCDGWPGLLIPGLNHYCFFISSCVLSYQVYPQNHRIVTIFFFLNSPSAAEFSSADLVENAGSAVCWGLALAGCILYLAVSSGCDLLHSINSLLCSSSLEVDAAWGSSCQSLD